MFAPPFAVNVSMLPLLPMVNVSLPAPAVTVPMLLKLVVMLFAKTDPLFAPLTLALIAFAEVYAL